MLRNESLESFIYRGQLQNQDMTKNNLPNEFVWVNSRTESKMDGKNWKVTQSNTRQKTVESHVRVL